MEILDEFKAAEEIEKEYPTLAKLEGYLEPSFYFREIIRVYYEIEALKENAEKANNFLNIPMDENDPDLLKNIGILFVDGEPPKQLIQAVGNYLLSQAEKKNNEIINTRPQGRPGNGFAKQFEKRYLMEVVFELKHKQDKTWSETASIINSSKFREGKAEIKHTTLQREFRSYKSINEWLIDSWDKNGTTITIEDFIELGIG